MKFNKKSILIDLLVLLIPLIIMIMLTPILPDKIPIQWNYSGACKFIDKEYSFVLGIIPFALYKIIKLKYYRK